MTGLILMFWATPVMTVGHMLFSVVVTAYILLSVKFSEEPRLKVVFKDYNKYMESQPSMYIPNLWAPAKASNKAE